MTPKELLNCHSSVLNLADINWFLNRKNDREDGTIMELSIRETDAREVSIQVSWGTLGEAIYADKRKIEKLLAEHGVEL